MRADPAQACFDRLFGPEFGHGRAFDLAPLRAALAALGDPQERLAPVVHIAGTNGKGSTLAFLRAMAEAQGRRVHVFSKPHLIALNERFRVAGGLVETEALIAAAVRVKATGAAMSQFEAQIACAFLLFSETRADLVLLETGFGGRDDATNVIARPALVLLSPIDLDHQAVLGDTIEAIAAHKAGIIKPGRPAISARQRREADAIIESAATERAAPLLRCGRDWDAFARHGRLIVETETRALALPLPRLEGAQQAENAGLAARAALELDLSEEAIAAGVERARWPARLQPLARGALAAGILAAGGELWIDGGHNAHAARALRSALDALARRAPRKTIAIVALRARKDAAAFVSALAPALAKLIAIPLERDEGAEPDRIADYARAAGIAASTAASLESAAAQALLEPAPRVILCGSFLLAGAALSDAGVELD